MDVSSGNPLPFGPSIGHRGVNFAVASKPATKVSLCLFDIHSLDKIAEFSLDPEKNKTGNVWHIEVAGLDLPILYGWRMDGPKGPGKRYRFDPERVLLDPFAPAVYSPDPWGAHGKSPYYGTVLPADDFDWEGDRPLNIPPEKLIIYEMHVRSFTQHTSSGVQHPGTYRGLIEKIPYLVDLGINAVELMPVYAFDECKNPFKSPETGEPLLNVWGYSPLSFMAPMPRFSNDLLPTSVVNEFKEMVKALHKAGIEVILDVVYNHTGEGGYGEPPLTLKGIDNSAYYMLDVNNQPMDFTGCGNTVNCNYGITKELIISSLRYWVTEMHIDGFRFDLASVLNRGRYGRPLGTAPIVESMSHDPILGKTKLIAEPWDAAGMYQVGAFYPQEERWKEWNGKYRDTVRRFVNCLGAGKGEFATRLSGSQDLYGHGRRPTSSINFVTAHDGFTLRDLVSYSQKHNDLNGEDNRDGSNDNNSWNCGVEGETDEPAVLKLREKQIKNFIATLLLSLGVPMVLMGDEYGHTRNGNNNSYCQDNELNWFLWDMLEKEKGLYQFMKGMIALRKSNTPLQHSTFLTEKEISWHGVKPMYQEWDNPDPVLAFTLYDKEKSQHLYTAYNMRNESAEIVLPDPPEGLAWHVLVNTSLESPEDISDDEHAKAYVEKEITLDDHTVVVMKALPRKTKATTGQLGRTETIAKVK